MEEVPATVLFTELACEIVELLWFAAPPAELCLVEEEPPVTCWASLATSKNFPDLNFL